MCTEGVKKESCAAHTSVFQPCDEMNYFVYKSILQGGPKLLSVAYVMKVVKKIADTNVSHKTTYKGEYLQLERIYF